MVLTVVVLSAIMQRASENLIPLGNKTAALVIKQSEIRDRFTSYSSVHISPYLALHNEQLDMQRVCL